MRKRILGLFFAFVLILSMTRPGAGEGDVLTRFRGRIHSGGL